MQRKLLQSRKYMGKVWSMNTMPKGNWATRSELAKEMGVSSEAVRQMEKRGKIIPQDFTLEGRPLFSKWYVEKLLSERDAKMHP